MNNRQKSLLFVHLSVLLFGLPGVIGKILTYSPLQLTWFRVFLASLTLLLIIKWQKENFLGFKFKDFLWLLVAGSLLAFHWGTFFWSVKLSTVGIGLLSYSTFPIFTVFLEPFLLKSDFNRNNIIFALLCFSGVLIMVPEFRLTNQVFLGIIWGVISGLSFSLLTIINRRLSPKYSSLILAFYQQFLAALWLLPLFLSSAVSLKFSLKSIIYLLVLGIICTAGAHTLFIKALKYLEAQTSSLISALEPVYGIIFGYFFLKEVPGLKTLSGGALILASVISVSLLNLRKNKERL